MIIVGDKIRHLFQNRSLVVTIGILVALSAIALYIPAIDNDFVNWDDEFYIINNVHILSLDFNFLSWAFFDIYFASWHPFTWLSHALDYAIWKLDPFGHHLTSVVLHGLNTFLVVLLFSKILLTIHKKGRNTPLHDNKSLFLVLLVGLLFAFHPIHVESVAWVSERKDVLYSSFYLLSLIFYIDYVDHLVKHNRNYSFYNLLLDRRYIASLILFVSSLLSKPMAISLPFVLLILDWYPLNRFINKQNLKFIIIEKTPFLVLSFITGIVTIVAQSSGFIVPSIKDISISIRILIAIKALISYMEKIIFPINFIPLYPYPEKIKILSLGYGLPVLAFIIIIITCFTVLRKQKFIHAALIYYVVTLLPVLGLVQVGRQSMADRYTYLPSLGPFILLASGILYLYSKISQIDRHKILLNIILWISLFYLFINLAFITVKQINVWENSVTLWSYEIKNKPDFPEPYLRRGNAYRVRGLYSEALDDFSNAILLNPFSNPDYYNDRGIVYTQLGEFEAALRDFNIALTMNPLDTNYLKNRDRALVDIKRIK